MSELPAAQHRRLQSWATRAIANGWLAENALDAVDSASGANPGQLFDESARPLVVGLFGGTGVGKSSLLNRLAGQNVARASAERPTSRDITVFIHRSISVDRLPDAFPMQRMRTALHNNDDYRQIMFIDMPDFDSVEQSNRELVELWMPHLDVVLYVVSPERYRDDMGWQLLQRHASEHAWLFVINQWDRGDEAQLTDFTHILETRGLSNPLIFCTDCANPQHAPGSDSQIATDDFLPLQKTLIELSDQQIVHALQKYGVLARLQQLKSQSDPWLNALDDQPTLDALPARWGETLEKQQLRLREAMLLPIEQAAQTYVDDTPFWRSLFGLSSQKEPAQMSAAQQTAASLAPTITDRLDTVLTQFINQQAHESQLPLTALNNAFQGARTTLTDGVELKLQNSLSLALLHPGKIWHRRAHKLMGRLCLLLPLASLGWISYRVVSGFVAGSSDPSAYLNSNFAINGALLIGVSWLLPAMAHTYLRPSTEAAARQGMHNGMNGVVEHMDGHALDALEKLSNESAQLRLDYLALWSEWPGGQSIDMPEAVQRMLSDKLFNSHNAENINKTGDQSADTLRVLDVRANTQSSTDAAPLS